MQVARLALRVAAIVIEDAIGDVRVLLDFAEDEAAADCVRGAGGNEDGITGAHRNVFEAVLGGAVGDRALEFFGGDARLEADEDFRAFARAQRRTTFRSCRRPPAAVSWRAAKSSSGWTCTESFSSAKINFTSSGKSLARSACSSGPLRRQLGPHFAQFFAGKWPGGEAALVAGHPRFAERLGQIGFLREKAARENARPRGAD